MLVSIFVCIGGFVCLLWILRHYSVSLGLPVAYLLNLLLIHVPGAVAHILDRNRILPGKEYTSVGILFTAIGTVCFVAGVLLVHFRAKAPIPTPAPRTSYWKFCLLAGWISTAGAFVINIPSISAVIMKGGAIWMLGIMLALQSSLRRGDPRMAWRWLATLAVYPVLMLLVGGFLSYGILAVTVVLAILAVHVRSTPRVIVGSVLSVVVGISLFLSYFEHRKEIRAAVWGGASADARIEASLGAVRDASVFDPQNPAHLKALDARLNQNYFAGLAAARIATGKVDYLHGQSLWEGFLSLVPRALWPDKPVVAGSGNIVSEMTGLTLAKGTSFGVGNVMEFQINFGITGILVGFLVFGLFLGWLDRRAAETDLTGDLGNTFLYFLPAVAAIQPNGSVVEIVSGAASALAAGFAWRWAWHRWLSRSMHLGRIVTHVSEAS